MSHHDTEQTYQALRRAILRAQEAGVRIVCEQFHIRDESLPTRPVIACCAVSAGSLFGSVILSDDEVEFVARGFDGITTGFPSEHQAKMRDVGLRLRDEFRPITATEFERELGVTS